jgi:hypothetical protein
LNQTAEVIDVKEPEPQDEFVRGLALIYQRLKQSKHLKKAMKEVESSLLELLGVRLFTIYQCVQNGKEVHASFKGGDPDDNNTTEIRVPFSPTSLVGYVALSQRALVIRNVLDQQAGVAGHPPKASLRSAFQ